MLDPIPTSVCIFMLFFGAFMWATVMACVSTKKTEALFICCLFITISTPYLMVQQFKHIKELIEYEKQRLACQLENLHATTSDTLHRQIDNLFETSRKHERRVEHIAKNMKNDDATKHTVRRQGEQISRLIGDQKGLQNDVDACEKGCTKHSEELGSLHSQQRELKEQAENSAKMVTQQGQDIQRISTEQLELSSQAATATKDVASQRQHIDTLSKEQGELKRQGKICTDNITKHNEKLDYHHYKIVDSLDPSMKSMKILVNTQIKATNELQRNFKKLYEDMRKISAKEARRAAQDEELKGFRKDVREFSVDFHNKCEILAGLRQKLMESNFEQKKLRGENKELRSLLPQLQRSIKKLQGHSPLLENKAVKKAIPVVPSGKQLDQPSNTLINDQPASSLYIQSDSNPAAVLADKSAVSSGPATSDADGRSPHNIISSISIPRCGKFQPGPDSGSYSVSFPAVAGNLSQITIADDNSSDIFIVESPSESDNKHQDTAGKEESTSTRESPDGNPFSADLNDSQFHDESAAQGVKTALHDSEPSSEFCTTPMGTTRKSMATSDEDVKVVPISSEQRDHIDNTMVQTTQMVADDNRDSSTTSTDAEIKSIDPDSQATQKLTNDETDSSAAKADIGFDSAVPVKPTSQEPVDEKTDPSAANIGASSKSTNATDQIAQKVVDDEADSSTANTIAKVESTNSANKTEASTTNHSGTSVDFENNGARTSATGAAAPFSFFVNTNTGNVPTSDTAGAQTPATGPALLGSGMNNNTGNVLDFVKHSPSNDTSESRSSGQPGTLNDVQSRKEPRKYDKPKSIAARMAAGTLSGATNPSAQQSSEASAASVVLGVGVTTSGISATNHRAAESSWTAPTLTFNFGTNDAASHQASTGNAQGIPSSTPPAFSFHSGADNIAGSHSLVTSAAAGLPQATVAPSISLEKPNDGNPTDAGIQPDSAARIEPVEPVTQNGAPGKQENCDESLGSREAVSKPARAGNNKNPLFGAQEPTDATSDNDGSEDEDESVLHTSYDGAVLRLWFNEAVEVIREKLEMEGSREPDDGQDDSLGSGDEAQNELEEEDEVEEDESEDVSNEASGKESNKEAVPPSGTAPDQAIASHVNTAPAAMGSSRRHDVWGEQDEVDYGDGEFDDEL